MSAQMNFKLSQELKFGFESEVDSNDSDVSTVLRELMKAYIELSDRAKGRRLPRLDLCGFEDDEVKRGHIHPVAPSFVHVSARPAGSHSVKTEKVRT